jgi:hypothetical protein
METVFLGALQTDDWAWAKFFLNLGETCLPQSMDKTKRCSPFTFLAEKHVEMTKTVFQEDDLWKQKRRHRVAAILRDCCEKGP